MKAILIVFITFYISNLTAQNIKKVDSDSIIECITKGISGKGEFKKEIYSFIENRKIISEIKIIIEPPRPRL